MPIDVGELQATLGINTRGFTDGVDSAQESLDGLIDRLGDGIQQSSADAADGLDSAKQGANEFSDAIEQAGKTSKTSAEKIKTAGQNTEKTGEQIKKAGEKAQAAEKILAKFKEAAGAIGIGVGIGALISKLTEIIQKFNEARQASERAAVSFERSLGSGNVNTGLYSDYIAGLLSYTSYGEEDIAATVAKVVKSTPTGTDAATITELSKQYLALGEMGGEFGGLTSNIEKSAVVFNKWGIEVEDQTRYLSIFADVCRNSTVDMDTLLSTLSELDYVGGKMNMTLDQAAAAVGNAGYEIGDINAVLSAGETYYTKFYDKVAEGFTEGMTSADMDAAVNAQWQDAIDAAAAMPESERAKFWSALIGDGGISSMLVQFAKGMNLLSTAGGNTFSADTTPSELLTSTWSSDTKMTVANALYDYDRLVNSPIFQNIADSVEYNADRIIETWRARGTLEDGLLDEIRSTNTAVSQLADKGINTTVYLEVTTPDPYAVNVRQSSDAVAAVSNPNYS